MTSWLKRRLYCCSCSLIDVHCYQSTCELNWTGSSSWLTNWNDPERESQSHFSTNSQSASTSWCQAHSWAFDQKFIFVWSLFLKNPRRLVKCLEADPSENTARNSTCFVAIVGYHGNSVYRAVTDLRKRYLGSDLVTCGSIPWRLPHQPR
jgi:hypothetical protein